MHLAVEALTYCWLAFCGHVVYNHGLWSCISTLVALSYICDVYHGDHTDKPQQRGDLQKQR